MTMKEHHKENLDELALIKVAAWTWYRHGPGSDQRTISESDYTKPCDIIVGSSRYKLEAMNKAHDDTRMSTRYISNPLFSTDYADSSLLDVYEIERISMDLDHYIGCSGDKYLCRKCVDGVHDFGSRRIMPLPERNSGGIKDKRTSTQRKWFRQIYELCGSNKGDVVENVGFATARTRDSKKHIPVAGEWNFHRKATSM
ncbi:hypothetical protein L2E82_43361 [Cichorium intybus]|uniref:Uncharacterized protein n=1 Tax=Cichorium intybus TaxID=13427 RepID=A0ACB8ZNU2_CICIN|nr:hypothetical protein L2E82_43361 [Cichorium intybus]